MGNTKHERVRDYILRGIREGRYLPGTKIPTEDALMRALGFSRSPVRHAVAELEQAGYVTRIHGSGSFVKGTPDDRQLDIFTLLYADSRGIEKDFVYGMRRAANASAARDLRLVLRRPGKDTSEMIEILQSLPSTREAGVIVVPVLSGERPLNRLLAATLRRLEKRGMPVVQLDRFVPEYGGRCVMCDHRRGAREMTELLLARGHRRIAILYEHPENTSIQLRTQGVRESLHRHGLRLPGELQIEVPIEHVRPQSRELVGALRRAGATAVFCFECELARELYQALGDAGLRVPRDISLCSFDDHCFPAERGAFLTAVVQPLERLGQAAVEMVLQGLEDGGPRRARLVLRPSIVERQSVGAC